MNKDKYAILTDMMCRVLSVIEEYGEDVDVSVYRYNGTVRVTVRIGSDDLEYSVKEAE